MVSLPPLPVMVSMSCLAVSLILSLPEAAYRVVRVGTGHYVPARCAHAVVGAENIRVIYNRCRQGHPGA